LLHYRRALDGPAVGFAGETFTVSNVGPAQ